MWHSNSNERGLTRPERGTQSKQAFLLLCIMLIAYLLTSCSSASATATVSPTPTPTATATPTPPPTPTPSPTPTPTPRPKPTQPPPPVPTKPQGAPAVLDLRPLSMSIVGHLDCQKNGAYFCQAQVSSRIDAQSNLNWFAFTNVPGNIRFSPAGGSLAPGNSVLITITVPLNACTPGLFFFRGPINTHTITWAC